MGNLSPVLVESAPSQTCRPTPAVHLVLGLQLLGGDLCSLSAVVYCCGDRSVMKIEWIASVCQRYLISPDMIVTVRLDLSLALVTRNGNTLKLVTAQAA